MKKLFTLILAISLLLTGCSYLAEAEPQVEAMLDAIANEDVDAAIELMHPNSRYDKDVFSEQFTAWCDVIQGRKCLEYSFTGISVQTNSSRRTETASCKLTLEDGTKIILEYTYVEYPTVAGFSSFFVTPA